MSNARSPREVCSITMGINGLIRFRPPSLSGGPDFRLDRLLLLGRPELLASAGELDRNPLHVRGDPVECAAQAQILANVLEPLGCEHLGDRVLVLSLLAQS